MKRVLSLCCALALLLALASCGSREPEPSGSPAPEPTSAVTPTPESSPTPDPTPTPSPTPEAAVWDADHTLDREPPELTAAGLELPVNGASRLPMGFHGAVRVMSAPST